MSVLPKLAPERSLTHSYPLLDEGIASSISHRRLSDVFEAAQRVAFDDFSRLVFLSDCHRADGSRADRFTPNENLFLAALEHYYRRGYTYVEVGDGDELYQNGMSAVLRAHPRTYEMLHRLNREGRLLAVAGNHDTTGLRRDRIEKAGIVAEEGLILRHTATGQQVFVVHGHQADFLSDQFRIPGRFFVRHFWKRWLLLGNRSSEQSKGEVALRPGLIANVLEWLRVQRECIERRILAWISDYQQTVICGHTHVARSASYCTPPYFNTGCCVRAGVLTGLEIVGGEIAPIRWTARGSSAGPDVVDGARRSVAPWRKLQLLG